MTPREVANRLNALPIDDFAFASEALVDHWISAKVGLEAVDPILRFMEENPSIDYGTPGALVHFVEQFYRHGYEKKLLESIARKPTSHTIWMLNGLINGARNTAAKRRLVMVMANAKTHPLADADALDRINMYLEYLGVKS